MSGLPSSGSSPYQGPANSLSELKARAVVPKEDAGRYAAKAWIGLATKLYQQGDASYEANDLESAYVSYLKGCSIVVEIIPKALELNKNDPVYIDLRKSTVNRYLSVVEKIAETLESQFKSRNRDIANPNRLPIDARANEAGRSNNISSSPHSQLEDRLNALQSLPNVPTTLPSANSMKMPIQSSTTLPPSSQFRHNTPPPIPSSSTKPQWVAGAPPPPPTSTKPTSWRASHSHHIPSPVPSPSQSKNAGSPTPSNSSYWSTSKLNISLPTQTSNTFPRNLDITPEQLVKYLTQKQNPPSILLMDVRPREEFENGCIRHKYIIQIEPLTLRQGITSSEIESSLCMNPDFEQVLFSERVCFDLIVYYDRNSTSIIPSITDYGYSNGYLKNLKSAIYETEFLKILPRIPVLLVGGFEAWRAFVKDPGVFVFKNGGSENAGSRRGSVEPSQKENGELRGEGGVPGVGHVAGAPLTRTNAVVHRSNVDGPVINRTLYDYFHQQSDGTNLQSMVQPNYNPVAQYHGYPTTIPPPLRKTPPLPAPMPQPSHISASPPLQQQSFRESESARPKNPHPTASAAGATGLSRRNTFIDNPYNGFTSTASTNAYYAPPPPLAMPPGRPLPQPPVVNNPPLPQRPPPPVPPKKLIRDPEVNARPMPPLPTAGQLPVSSSSFSQLGSVSIGTTGLKNLGNTCFMNSVIQCLSGTIPLARYFMTGIYKQHINKRNRDGTGGVLAEAYANLIRIMWSEQYTFVSPVTFREAVGRFGPQFAGSEQQDSQEFLAFLLDSLHEDLNQITQRPSPTPESEEEEGRFERLPDWEASALAWDRYLARNSSFIVSMFQGQFKNRLQCLTCGQTSTTYNTFMFLSLPIPTTKSGPDNLTLSHCLDNFVREEILEGADEWLCSRCKKRRRATKRLTLSRLPDVLLIHLKRFSFNGPFRDKLEAMVRFPLIGLDLTPYMPSYIVEGAIKGPNGLVAPNGQPINFSYDLYAVSNHFGGLNGGHYTACVRNGYRGQWHNFDDSRVSVLDDERAVVSRAAYNLYYVKSTV